MLLTSPAMKSCCALNEAFSMEKVHPEAAEGDCTGKALEV